MFLTAQRLFDGRTPEVFDNWGIEIDDGRIVDIGPVRAMRPAVGRRRPRRRHAAAWSDRRPPASRLRRLGPTRSPSSTPTTTPRCCCACGWPRNERSRSGSPRSATSATATTYPSPCATGSATATRSAPASSPPARRITTSPAGTAGSSGGEADGADGIRQAVRERVARGVDVIKVMASGGNMTPDARAARVAVRPSELPVAVEEAHAHGLTLAVHAHGAPGRGRRARRRCGLDRALHVLQRRGRRCRPRRPPAARRQRHASSR